MSLLHPLSPAQGPIGTRTAVEGVDPGEARQAPVAKRLHARGSAQQRLLAQMGNPTLIAQQRREGAGRRGAGRSGQTREVEVAELRMEAGEPGKQVVGRSKPQLPR